MKRLLKSITVFMVLTMALTACSSGKPSVFPDLVTKEAETLKPATEAATKEAATEKPSEIASIPQTEASKEESASGGEGQETSPLETPEETTQEITPAETPEQTKQEPVLLPDLDVSPIPEKTMSVSAYALKEYRAERAEILEYKGKFTGSGQEETYKLKAKENGIYRFELSGLKNGFTISMFLYDQDEYRMDVAYGCTNGDGITAELEKGKTYKIVLQEYDGTGNYVFSIGQQKKTVDLSEYTVLQDAMEFTDQRIDYTYIPKETGIYRFGVGQVKSGFTVTMSVYDDLEYRVDIIYGLGKDDGLVVELEKGKIYLFRLEKYGDLGDFTVNIGIQKAVTELPDSGYTVLSDSMQFSEQENIYSIHPAASGLYRFEIGKIKAGDTVSMMLTDEDGYQLDHIYGLGTGDGMDAELEGNKNYTIKVIQYSGLGDYTMIVGCPKDTVSIDGAVYGGMTDSIQYTSQINRCEYISAAAGTKYFCISEAEKDMAVTIRILDDDGMVIDSAYGMEEGDAYAIDLKEGQKCVFELVYYKGLGNYTMTFQDSAP